MAKIITKAIRRICDASMTLSVVASIGLFLACLPAQAATLLPPGKSCFSDDNGEPLAGGTINFYIPATTTPKNTYQNSDQSVLNTNPVVLDSAGCAIIYGSGTYRQIVKDSLGNLIWDQLTASTGGDSGQVLYGGTSTGSGNAQTIAPTGFTATDGVLVSFIAGFSNTGATTLDAGTGGIAVRFDSTTGPVVLSGGEIRAGNAVVALYSGGFFHLIGGPVPIQYLPVVNYQVFTASGTWAKPTVGSGSDTLVQCWGGGGGGGANATGGAGGGGSFAEMTFRTSSLGATETVTIGAGGAVNAQGGQTSFGTLLSAFGGGAGQNGANGGGGGGGGASGVGSNGAASAGGVGGLPGQAAAAAFGISGGGGGNNGGNGGRGFYGGGGGGGFTGNGGDSLYGGGGGGSTLSGGTSKFGGAGGNDGIAGTAPAGGGGKNAAGARGECRVWTTP